jgi:hypothetical protein
LVVVQSAPSVSALLGPSLAAPSRFGFRSVGDCSGPSILLLAGSLHHVVFPGSPPSRRWIVAWVFGRTTWSCPTSPSPVLLVSAVGPWPGGSFAPCCFPSLGDCSGPFSLCWWGPYADIAALVVLPHPGACCLGFQWDHKSDVPWCPFPRGLPSSAPTAWWLGGLPLVVFPVLWLVASAAGVPHCFP